MAEGPSSPDANFTAESGSSTRGANVDPMDMTEKEQVAYVKELSLTKDVGVAAQQTRDPVRKQQSQQVYCWPEPLQLVHTSDVKMTVVDATVAKLSLIKVPLVVVSIVGMYRTGKSYLMNRLAGRPGFAVGGTIQAQTKGIWIWCLLHPRHDDRCLVLMDTEGLGDTEQVCGKTESLQFMLATMLSSILVYNSTKTIDSDAMSKLQFVTELADKFRVKETMDNEYVSEEDDDETDEDAIAQFSPKFVWVIRDFTLELAVDGRAITADQYLEKTLASKKGYDTKTDEYNRPRRKLKTVFPERKCFAFPYPTVECGSLAALSHQVDDQTSQQFQSVSNQFLEYIYSQGEAKTVAEIQLDGQKISNLLAQYVQSLNENNVTIIWNVIEATAKHTNAEAVKEAVQQYTESMRKGLLMPVSNERVLEDNHKRCEKEARKLFFKRAMVTKDAGNEFQEMLARDLSERYDEICREDKKVSKDHCNEILHKLFEKIQLKIAEGTYIKSGGLKEYESDMSDMKQKYEAESGKGVMADAVLQVRITSQATVATNIASVEKMLDEVERRYEAAIQKLQKKIADAQDQNDYFRQQLDRMEQSKQTMMKQQELYKAEQAKKLAETDRKLQMNMKKAEEEMQQMQLQCQTLELQLEQRLQAEAQAREHVLKITNTELQKMQQKQTLMKDQHIKEQEDLANKLKETKINVEKANAEMIQEMRRQEALFKDQKEELKTRLEAIAKEKELHLQNANAEMEDMKRQLTMQKDENVQETQQLKELVQDKEIQMAKAQDEFQQKMQRHQSLLENKHAETKWQFEESAREKEQAWKKAQDDMEEMQRKQSVITLQQTQKQQELEADAQKKERELEKARSEMEEFRRQQAMNMDEFMKKDAETKLRLDEIERQKQEIETKAALTKNELLRQQEQYNEQLRQQESETNIKLQELKNEMWKSHEQYTKNIEVQQQTQALINAEIQRKNEELATRKLEESQVAVAIKEIQQQHKLGNEQLKADLLRQQGETLQRIKKSILEDAGKEWQNREEKIEAEKQAKKKAWFNKFKKRLPGDKSKKKDK